jgi:predicted O-linked N-acetylglucosamine transferase (SPINDLY family)
MLHITPSSANIVFDMARQYHDAAQFDRAAELCDQILAVLPDHVGTLHLAGVLARHANQPALAITLLERAAAADPLSPEIAYDLAHAQWLTNPAAAVDSYRRAIALRPDFPEAYDGLGNALAAVGKNTEAIDAFLQAISRRPHFAQCWNNLGNALLADQRKARAVEAYTRATELDPALVEAHVGLGAALLAVSQSADAIAAFRHALTLRPDLPEAHNNLGAALMEVGELEDSVAACNRAIELRPDYPEAHSNLGNTLRKQEKIEEAIAAYRRALELRPQYAEAIANLASALIVVSQFDEALTLFRTAIEIRPDFAASQNLLFCLQFLPTDDPEAIFREHVAWNNRYAAHLAGSLGPPPNDRSPDRRLRIGYVSPDFRNHCQSFFTVPLLSAHDHQHFEIFLYADVPHPDAITERIRTYADTWRDTAGLSDQQLAELIREDRIDILVDLTMHMAKGRPGVFARKVAPVQVTWLAYPGTTGLTAIDYRLSDPYLDPVGEESNDAFYAEKTVRLPDTFWCYDPLVHPHDFPVAPLPALTNGHLTFGCFNNFAKINDRTLALWSQVLHALPTARLLLLAPQGELRTSICRKLNIAADRITFIDRCLRPEYLHLYDRIDLCLDTFPYNGHTTSLDGLWMGVPAVTRVGRSAVARAGLSQLTNLRLTDFIAKTDEQFVEITRRAAAELERLAAVRLGLREQMKASPLMEGRRFARAMEEAYRRMWVGEGE